MIRSSREETSLWRRKSTTVGSRKVKWWLKEKAESVAFRSEIRFRPNPRKADLQRRYEVLYTAVVQRAENAGRHRIRTCRRKERRWRNNPRRTRRRRTRPSVSAQAEEEHQSQEDHRCRILRPEMKPASKSMKRLKVQLPFFLSRPGIDIFAGSPLERQLKETETWYTIFSQ